MADDKDLTRRNFLARSIRITAGAMLFPAAGACQQAAPAAASNDEAIAGELNVFVENLTAEDKFSGAVLLAKDDKVIFRKAYGLASKEFDVANRTNTKFNVASMGKMFTAVAVARLEEQGKISFDDLVGKHLPDYPKEVADTVTIHHLLTHTSGMGSYWKEEFHESNHARYRTIRDYLPLFVNDPLEFKPGEKWSYSNAGFIVLGAVIERVTGQSYFDYVKENVFGRAGMVDTDFYETDRITPHMATGYTKQNRYLRQVTEWTNTLFISPVKGTSAGGGYSTVEDLFRFSDGLRRHKLLSAKATETVLTGKVEYGGGANRKYAYGFANDVVNGQRIIFHDGGANGVSAEFDFYPDTGHTIIVLSNYDHPAARPVVKKAQELVAASLAPSRTNPS